MDDYKAGFADRYAKGKQHELATIRALQNRGYRVWHAAEDERGREYNPCDLFALSSTNILSAVEVKSSEYNIEDHSTVIMPSQKVENMHRMAEYYGVRLKIVFWYPDGVWWHSCENMLDFEPCSKLVKGQPHHWCPKHVGTSHLIKEKAE